MTKATRDGRFPLFARHERGDTTAGRAVTLGPYTYIPAPGHSSATVNGTLTKGGLPVTLRVTEPLLQDFLDAVGRVEDDLARRWAGTQDLSTLSGAE